MRSRFSLFTKRPIPPTPILLGLVGVVLACPGAWAAGEATVMLADGRTLEKTAVKPGATAEQITLEQAGQPPVAVAPNDLLVVDFGKVPGRAVTPTVRMANGDQVVGKVQWVGPKQLKVAAGWGTLTVPLSWCSAVRLKENAPLPESTGKDALVLGNDRVEGPIQGVKDGKITVELSGKPLAVDLSRVLALSIAPREKAPDKAAGLTLALDLGGGERLTGRWVKLTPDVLTVKLDWGENVDVPVASISRMEVKNGKLVYLSDLRPAEVRQTGYFDEVHPFQKDRAVSGRTMRMGGKAYRRGLGTHSRSELTYQLDGAFETFAATVGLDDAVGPQGSVVFRVYGDEKLLFESPVVRGGDKPQEIKLNIKRVLLLRLEVDFADNGDAADHADWAEARLLKP